MAARRRSHKTRDLPPNLYDRNGYYSYRDPRTGTEFGLGRDKRYAVTQAIEANISFSDAVGSSLVDRINNMESVTMEMWCDRYMDLLERRNISMGSMAEYRSRVNAVRRFYSNRSIESLTTKDIAEFLEAYITAGKAARAKLMRSTMLDMFREAIAEGVIKNNPVEATRNARIAVKRSRLSASDLSAIITQAGNMQEWLPLSIKLAAVTGQRVSDISKMAWADIQDGKLRVEQKKTGMKLAIPLSTKLSKQGLCLSDIIDECRGLYSRHSTLIASRSGGMLSVETISRAFSKARDATGIKWEGDPPSFHELRSLSARLHATEKDEKYAQNLLGHKSAQMSERYIDARGSEWLEVE